MNSRTAWLVYTVLRLAFFAVPFAVIMLLGWPWWLAAVIATLVAVSLSVIFLSTPREAASESIYEWRHRDRTADDIVEDDAVEAGAAAAPAPAPETTGPGAGDTETTGATSTAQDPGQDPGAETAAQDPGAKTAPAGSGTELPARPGDAGAEARRPADGTAGVGR